METLKVTLKQHTPLIHFQHDQHGATLRASEVKPKLDKYIVQKAFKNKFEDCRSYLVGYDPDRPDALKEKFAQGYRALNYKMRIITSSKDLQYLYMNKLRPYRDNDRRRNKPFLRRTVDGCENTYLAKIREPDYRTIFDLDKYPLYFGNMNADYDDNSEYKKMSLTREPIDCCFQFMVRGLLERFEDKELLSSFFLCHNFGTRQSKGFGSFYIDEKDILYVKPSSAYSFRIDKEQIEPGEEPLTDDDVYYRIFSLIDLFYKTLRGGINLKDSNRRTKFYFKSLAFMYCKDKLEAKWDKKKVKEEFYRFSSPNRLDSLDKQLRDHVVDVDNEILTFDSRECYDMRDLLGFSTNEYWQSFGDSIEKKVAVVNHQGILDFPPLGAKVEVERMQSPILFKPICSDDTCEVYIVFQDEKVNLKGFKECLKICVYSKREREKNGFKKRFKIDIPQDFSCRGYFDYIFNLLQFDIEQHVNEKYHDHEYYEELEKIYTQLKNSSKK